MMNGSIFLFGWYFLTDCWWWQVAIFVVLAMALRRKPDVLVNVMPKIMGNNKYLGQEKLPIIVWVIAQVLFYLAPLCLLLMLSNSLPFYNYNFVVPILFWCTAGISRWPSDWHVLLGSFSISHIMCEVKWESPGKRFGFAVAWKVLLSIKL